ncbi:toxin-activating lysine-acyltransferase [Duganella vulcania]|uniref:RTX toxin-activating lysine-acyltransferase n=1 Tax=Duganella vulcania TaxID=2692166 RepID=A0A845GRJ0_9BURK|nr:toxin-activating lysine-acyltransferase [Duganella vulcania]MYM95199.1 toxin-activating lysine-acyltransferase [Duganella vulcania]
MQSYLNVFFDENCYQKDFPCQLGAAAYVYALNKKRRSISISSFFKSISLAINQRRILFCYFNGEIDCLHIWAYLNCDAEDKVLISHFASFDISDWSSGHNLWLVDSVSVSGENIMRNRPVLRHVIRRKVLIKRLKGRNALVVAASKKNEAAAYIRKYVGDELRLQDNSNFLKIGNICILLAQCERYRFLKMEYIEKKIFSFIFDNRNIIFYNEDGMVVGCVFWSEKNFLGEFVEMEIEEIIAPFGNLIYMWKHLREFVGDKYKKITYVRYKKNNVDYRFERILK